MTGNTDGSRFRGWHLLKTRDFGFLWSGQLVSQVGDGLNKVALLWLVYSLTGSALNMTIIGLLQTLPALLFAPVIGVYLDRMQKKWLMVWIDLLRTGLVLLIPVLYSLGALTLERIYVLVFLTAIASTTFGPALTSSVPLIVARPQLTAANALMQSGVNIAVLVGPAMSGVAIALFNLTWSGFLFLLPVVAQHVLGVGPLELGWLWSFLGVGMLAASAWLACVEQRDLGHKLRIIAGSMGVGGLAVGGLRLFGN